MNDRGMDVGLMKHTMEVLERTLEIHEKFDGNLKLLMAGALLHDIGRTVTHGVEHGVEGGKIIREQGWDEELARIVERHIGGGITREEAEEHGLPARNLLPETLEEKIVCHADNTAGGKERFYDLIDRIEQAGYHKSVERMEELAKEFDFNK
ncbi:MAG: HDIG domain-containing metalloprotein [Thermoplasmatota archaeon]